MQVKTEMETQISTVLSYLKKHRTITSMQAFEMFGVTRLAGIICKLRKRGYLIKTVMCETKTRYGTNSQYAKYQYVKFDGADNRLNVMRLRGEI